MKINLLLMLGFVLNISANTYSQNGTVSIQIDNKTVKDVFQIIEGQSKYRFLYNDAFSDLNKNVSFKVSEGNINQVLNLLFSGSNITYQFLENNLIVVTPRQLAQRIVISGIVTGETDQIPISGVTVIEKGTNNVVITDINGKYTIEVGSTNSTIVFSFFGFIPQEMQVGSGKIINVALKEEVIGIKEITITALGIKRQTAALGYSITEVKGSDLAVAKETNVINSLSGRIAGVDISSSIAGPSGSSRVVIRGNSQLTGDNQPLYVIDGVPMDNTQLGSASQWGGYDMGDGLSSVNADDVASISVLKGPSASALYGSRASNGVILITTKSGQKQTGLGIEFSSSVNIVSLLSKFDDYQTVYGQGRNGLLPVDVGSTQSAWGPKLDPTIQIKIYNGQTKPYGVVKNNILSFFRQGVTTDNSLSFSTGNENANVRMSYSNLTNRDIVPNSNMNRNTFMLKASGKLGNIITLDAKVNYINEVVNNRPALSDNPNNVGLSLIGIPANFDQHWLNEGYKDVYGNYVDWNQNVYRINPYWSINEITNKSTKDRFMGYTQANFDFTKWLSLQFRTGLDFYTFSFTDFEPVSTPTRESGYISESTQKVQENNTEVLLKFNNKFFNENLSISAYIGGNLMHYQSEKFQNDGIGLVIPGVKSVVNFSNKSVYWYPATKQINSLYGAVQSGYKDILFLDFTVRNDISSTLSTSNNSYIYPSVSSSLVFTNLLNVNRNILSFGKIRAAWAEVGGDTKPYQLDLTYGILGYSYNNIPLGQISNNFIPNRNLKPTRTYSTEFGTNVKFFNNRIGVDITYYSTQTRDQIVNMPISDISGYNFATINVGEITNNGIELSLNTTPVKLSNFSWDFDINYARNRNKVVKLRENIPTYTLSDARWAGATISAKEGEAFGVIMGRPLKKTDKGEVIYNADGYPEIGENPVVLGNGTYKWTGGLINTFTYKGISFRSLFDIKWGAKIFSMSDMFYHMNGISKETLEGRDSWYTSEEQRIAAGQTLGNWTHKGGFVGKGVVNTGTADNPIYVTNTTNVDPQLYWNYFYDKSPEPFIKDASFIKLREVSLSYNLNSKFLNKTPLKSITISIIGRNLLTLHSSVKNIDPESNYNNGNGQGFEYGSLPSRRNYGFNLNIKF